MLGSFVGVVAGFTKFSKQTEAAAEAVVKVVKAAASKAKLI